MSNGLKSGIPPGASECVFIPGRMPPHEVCYVNALLDDIDGIVVVRTVDSVEGRMEFWVAPDLVDEFMDLFNRIRDHGDIDMSLGEPSTASAGGRDA